MERNAGVFMGTLVEGCKQYIYRDWSEHAMAKVFGHLSLGVFEMVSISLF